MKLFALRSLWLQSRYPFHMNILDFYSRFLRLRNFKKLAIGQAITRFLKFRSRKNQVAKKPVYSGGMGILVLSFGLAHAGEMQTEISKTQFVTSFSLGPGWYQVDNSQSLLLQPEFTNTYVSNQNTYDLINGELFLGISRKLNSMLWGQIGIAGALTSNAKLSGVVLESGEPTLDNFTYSYNVSHAQVSIKGKLLTLVNQSWYPYISASLGAGFNSSTNYSSTPLLFEIIPIAPFTNNTITSFAYTLGVGIQKEITTHWQVGVGYEFSDWGKSKLGPIAYSDTTNAPSLNNFYVNQLMVNITFLT